LLRRALVPLLVLLAIAVAAVAAPSAEQSAARAAPAVAILQKEVPALALPIGASIEPHPGPTETTVLPAQTAVPSVLAATPSATTATPSAPAGESDPAVVLAAPHAPPRILAVAFSAAVVRGGETVVGRVRTTSNVASVEVRVVGFSTVMTRRGVGEFSVNYPVPVLPSWLHRTYPVEVIARNVDGVRETRTLEITLE
jgi:hypothetical protein